MVAPTDEIKIFCLIDRPSKDLYLTLHNKKETRGSLLSACFFLAIELNKRKGMSLWFTISHITLGNIGEVYVQTLDQPPQESFLLLFFKKEEKIITQTNFSPSLSAPRERPRGRRASQ